MFLRETLVTGSFPLSGTLVTVPVGFLVTDFVTVETDFRSQSTYTGPKMMGGVTTPNDGTNLGHVT